jgi:hypothetical protein
MRILVNYHNCSSNALVEYEGVWDYGDGWSVKLTRGQKHDTAWVECLMENAPEFPDTFEVKSGAKTMFILHRIK